MKKNLLRLLKTALVLLIVLSAFPKAHSQSSDFGVNLAGLEFTPSVLPGTPGVNYFVPTAANLDYYNGKGLKLIRLPFLWERVQPTLNGSLNTTYLGYIDNVVALAKARGMSVILDVHNYARYNGNIIGSPSVSTAQFADLWSKLANHYKNETAVYAYDIMNEPHTLGGYSWFNAAQAAITAIRAVDMTHVIMVEGDNWSHSDTWSTYNDNLKNLNDPANKIVYHAHMYFDWDNSGRYTSTSFSGNGANVNTGVAKSTNFINWLQANNKKGFFGEYGVPNNASASDQTNWNTLLNNFLNNLKNNCIGGTVWAGGPAWGSYVLSVEPNGATDRPQMSVLQNYTTLPVSCNVANQDIKITVGATEFASGSTYDFHNVISSGNEAVTFTITNTGLQGLNLTGTPRVAVSGTHSAQFVVTTQPASSSIASNASTTFVVTFSPGSIGTKSATLTIASDDPDENPYTINLIGTGTATATAPVISVNYLSSTIANNNSPSLNMGSTTANSQNTVGFTISNSGNNALNISGITATGTGYSVLAPIPTVVAAGASTTVWVRYSATASTGSFTGYFTIANDDVANPSYRVNLTTTVVSCAGSASGDMLQDWDGNYTNSTNIDTWNTAWQENQVNPSVNSTNPSNSVARFTRPATGSWNGVKYKLCGSNTISLTSSKYLISMLVYSPVTGVNVQMNLKTDADVANTTTYPSTATAVTSITKANQWERIYFDFSSVIGVPNITHAEIMIDPTATQGVVRVYHVDDIRLDISSCLADVPATGILMDYDDHRNMSFPFTPGDSYTDPTGNPSAAAPNTTPNCMRWIRNAPTGSPASDNYRLIRYKVCGNYLDLNTSFGSMISMAIYSPNVGIPVQMVLQNAATGSPVQIASSTVNTTKAGEWELLVFDFTSVKTNTNIKAIDIYIDPLSTNTSTLASRTYYIDEIKLANTLPCIANIASSRVLNDFDNNRHVSLAFATNGSWNDVRSNPFSGGLNTSSTVAEYGRVSGNYDVIRWAACGNNFDLNQGKTLLSFMLYSPVASVPVTMSLKDAAGVTLLDVNTTTTVTGAWEELTFDCSSLIYSPSVKFIDIMIDPLFTKGARTYYFDNFKYSNLPRILVMHGSTVSENASTVDFGDVTVGSNNSLTFSIENTGYNTLNLTGTPKITISGSSDFTIDQSSTSATIAGGAGTLFSVTFTPSSSGVKTATISIASNDASANPFTLTLTGTGKQVVMAVQQGATNIASGTGLYSFGSITTGSSSSAITFTISSTGTDTLRLTGMPKISIGGTNASDFTINQSSTLAKIHPAGGTTTSTTFTITFTPGATGARTATISIANNDPLRNPYTFSVSGTGACTVPSGTGSISGLTSVCNGSTGITYTLTGITGATGYSWSVPSGATITAGGTTSSITVTFGSSSGNVSVTPSNSCGNASVVSQAVTVNSSAAASVTISSSGGATTCPDISITFTASPSSGGSSPTYQWKLNSLNVGTNSSTYAATLSGGDQVSCVMTSSLSCSTGSPATSNTITVASAGTSPCIAPASQTISGPSTVTAGQTSVTYSITPTSGNTYSWSFPAGTVVTGGSLTSSTVTVTMPSTPGSGSVSVTETNAWGNTTHSMLVTINGATAINNASNASGVHATVYPNPFNETVAVVINCPAEYRMFIKVVDTEGRTVFESDKYYTNEEIRFGKDLESGLYLLTATFNNAVQLVKIHKQ